MRYSLILGSIALLASGYVFGTEKDVEVSQSEEIVANLALEAELMLSGVQGDAAADLPGHAQALVDGSVETGYLFSGYFNFSEHEEPAVHSAEALAVLHWDEGKTVALNELRVDVWMAPKSCLSVRAMSQEGQEAFAPLLEEIIILNNSTEQGAMRNHTFNIVEGAKRVTQLGVELHAVACAVDAGVQDEQVLGRFELRELSAMGSYLRSVQ